MVPLAGSGLESRFLVSWNGSVANPARDAFIALAAGMLAVDERRRGNGKAVPGDRAATDRRPPST